MKLTINNAVIPRATSTDIAPPVQLVTDNGLIQQIGRQKTGVNRAAGQTIDGSGLFLLPGFIDLQLNGGFGHDFAAEPQTIWQVGSLLPQYGITSYLPTIVTSPIEAIELARTVLQAGPPAGYAGSQPLGLHLEGPFLNPEKKGAHSEAYLKAPDEKLVENWSVEGGIRLVTLAPELPGAKALVRRLRQNGVVVSMGHSAATNEIALSALEAGVRYGTHLFNAMHPLQHREPGLIGALLVDNRPIIGLIADNIHVHPTLLQIVWRLVGPERLNIVSDAMAALGMPPGRYKLGAQTVIVDEYSARLEDGTLAGCILPLNLALRNLIEATSCTLFEAAKTVTSTPANLLGVAKKGRLEVGADADCVLLEKDCTVVATVIAGEIVHITDKSRLS